MGTIMRNTWTGEITEVEKDSAEFEAMRLSRRHTDDKPLWEETNRPDALEQDERLDAGAGTIHDVPDGGQPVDRIGLTPDTTGTRFGPDLTEPTPGEVSGEAGRAAPDGETPEDISRAAITREQIADAVEGDSLATNRGKVFDENNPDPADLEVQGGTASGSSDDDPYKGKTKDELIAEADSRGLDVQGTGANGNIKAEDLRSALKKDDESNGEAGENE